jgi:tRNA pseudouridine55 synthase
MRDGLLLVGKASGLTSHDVVSRARRVLGQRKIGHCGTLDPAATGLLVLTLGKATRLTRFLISAPKVYVGVIRLGTATDTYDASGTVISEGSTSDVTEEQVRSSLAATVGTFEQTAPPYSAKKVGGVKYYELARKGEEVPESRKEITLFDFEMTGPLEDDSVPFKLSCSSGTYVRTLAHDLGSELGCGAHLQSLERLQVGPFKLDDAIAQEALEAMAPGDELPQGAWVTFDEIPLPFCSIVTDTQQERRLIHGQTALIRGLEGDEGDWVKLMSPSQQFIAVGSIQERIGDGGVGVIQPRIVFKN